MSGRDREKRWPDDVRERPARLPRLTPREREVFTLLASGSTAPEIAAVLFLSVATVRTHVRNGVERLGARTRVHAVALALVRGEIEIKERRR